MATLTFLAPRAAPSAGSARTESSSLSAFVSTLIPLLLINCLIVGLFLVIRRKFQRIYEPRTYLGSIREECRTPRTSPGLLTWIKDFYALPDSYVLNHQSLDGYLYLRFYKIIVIICAVGVILTWPVLFPINATGGGGQTQFDILSFSNVANANRYYAHVFIAYLFFGFVMFVIARESLYYIHLRQAYLLSPRIASRISSRTVLFTDLPEDYMDEGKLRATFSSVKYIWLATDCDELEDLIEKERDKTAMKLEAAECALSKAGNEQRLKARKKGEEASNLVEWADANKRPTHRLMPLIGKKVDTIDWCRDHLKDIIPRVEEMQADHWNGNTTPIPAAFIEFENVQAAESAFQQVTFHVPKQVQARAIGVPPEQVIWKNLSVPWWRRDLLYVGATALVALLIICWTPITVLIGFISNINYLTQYKWLAWIDDIPSQILGIVTGLLPSLMLAIVVALVPIFMRIFAKLAGAISNGQVELMTQGWYFWFQVLIVFLLTTFASGSATVIQQIANDPTMAASLLAKNLPKASNFYIQYFIIFGLGTSAATLLNIVAVAIYFILGKFLDKTPRKKYNRYVNVGGVGWGSNYPKYTTIAVIAISYSCIAPLILGFAFVGLLLLYIAFRYDLIYTLDTTNADTQGATYAKALQQLTTGVYLGEVCMIGLFAINSGSGPASAGPLILMIIFLVITILFHIAMSKALAPLTKGLPRDLLAESTRKQGTASQLESGHRQGFLAQSKNTLPEDERRNLVNDRNSNGNGNSAVLGPPTHDSAFKRIIHRIMHPSSLPEFAAYLSDPVPDYPADIRREAYLNPAITSPTPLLWIVHDGMGISAREKAETGKVMGVSDAGAWWEEDSGKLVTIWEGVAEGKEAEMLRECPVFEEKVLY